MVVFRPILNISSRFLSTAIRTGVAAMEKESIAPDVIDKVPAVVCKVIHIFFSVFSSVSHLEALS